MSCDCESAPPQECPTGVPAWVLTFADLMSLLLAFFVLLLSFSEMDRQKYKQVAGSMRDAFGIQREIKIKEPPKGINIIAQEFSAGTPTSKTLENELRQRAGEETYPGSFIAYWVHDALFIEGPAWMFTVAYTLFGLLVVAALVWAPPRWSSSQVTESTGA